MRQTKLCLQELRNVSAIAKPGDRSAIRIGAGLGAGLATTALMGIAWCEPAMATMCRVPAAVLCEGCVERLSIRIAPNSSTSTSKPNGRESTVGMRLACRPPDPRPPCELRPASRSMLDVFASKAKSCGHLFPKPWVPPLYVWHYRPEAAPRPLRFRHRCLANR
jgi:hypothetical protein